MNSTYYIIPGPDGTYQVTKDCNDPTRLPCEIGGAPMSFTTWGAAKRASWVANIAHREGYAKGISEAEDVMRATAPGTL